MKIVSPNGRRMEAGEIGMQNEINHAYVRRSCNAERANSIIIWESIRLPCKSFDDRIFNQINHKMIQQKLKLISFSTI